MTPLEGALGAVASAHGCCPETVGNEDLHGDTSAPRRSVTKEDDRPARAPPRRQRWIRATAHGSRRTLEFGLTWFGPRHQGLIDFDASPDSDARTMVAAGTHPAAGHPAALIHAAVRFEPNTPARSDSTAWSAVSAGCAAWSAGAPTGPGPPRPSDTSTHLPEQIHPHLDDDGNIHQPRNRPGARRSLIGPSPLCSAPTDGPAACSTWRGAYGCHR